MSAGTGSAPFAAHNEAVGQLLRQLLAGTKEVLADTDCYLDGQASRDSRRLLDLDFRREFGAFFTPSQLRTEIRKILNGLPGERYLDPTCGAGDLLLTAAQTLPLEGNLYSTLRSWADKLHGWDIHEEFVNAARLRLVLLAATRHTHEFGHVRSTAQALDRLLKNIVTADVFDMLTRAREVQPDIAVMNPPYTRMVPPFESKWSSGKTSTAAILTLETLSTLRQGGHLVAILPDSLRSGSNYEKWRATVESRADVLQVKQFGLFDDFADVDVFVLTLRVRPSGPALTSAKWWKDVETEHSIGDYFTVKVGTVVDNRDPHEGEDTPFLVARDLPTSGSIEAPDRRRRFTGRTFTPPFVVVRRTSRPSAPGRARAVGVLVEGAEAIAVDNHLLVLQPIRGSSKSCLELLKVLDSTNTTDVLDNRIRCRHLTVGALRSIPWIS